MRPRHHELYEGEGVDGAVHLMEPILAERRPPDAIVATASRFAYGAARAAEKVGIDVPGDLMIAALTDSEFTRANNPPITAVDLVLEELAHRAVDLMLRRVSGDPSPTRPLVLQPELRWRQSTVRTG